MIISVIKAVVLCYVIILLLMYFFQRSLLYFPPPPPSSVNEQPITFKSEGQQLNGWVINPGQSNAIIYFGGNAEGIEQNATLFNEKLPNDTVYLIQYRGYGSSSGKPTEQALFSDALFIYDQIQAKYDTISTIGRSLGTGVATYLATSRTIANLVLITPFDSIVNVAQNAYPFLPVGLLMKDKYESWRRADKVTARTLVFIAGKDQIVPPIHAKKLLSHFTDTQASELTISDASHNDISTYPEYGTALSLFFEQ